MTEHLQTIMPRAVFFILLLFLQIKICGQDSTSSKNLNSPENILSFADFLFCEKDYLRAVDEYKKYLSVVPDDLVHLKIVKSYEYMGNTLQAEKELDSIRNLPDNILFNERVKLKYKQDDFSSLRNFYSNSEGQIHSNGQLYYLSFLLDSVKLPDKSLILSSFNSPVKEGISDFYSRKIKPGYKNPLLAGIMSSVLPGSGKIYTGDIGDGITALIITGLLTFISYDNFHAHHQVRGWIFGSLTALFYGGNIYGSVTSANIYNARLDFNYETELKDFIKQNNYFLPEDNNDCK